MVLRAGCRSRGWTSASSEHTLPEPVIAEDELLHPDFVIEEELLRTDSPVPAAESLLRADSPSPVPPANPMLPAATETVLRSPLQWHLLESNVTTLLERQPSRCWNDPTLRDTDLLLQLRFRSHLQLLEGLQLLR